MHTDTYTHICIYIHWHIYACIYTCVHVCTIACVNWSIELLKQKNSMRNYRKSYNVVSTHTHTHTHTHTESGEPNPPPPLTPGFVFLAWVCARVVCAMRERVRGSAMWRYITHSTHKHTHTHTRMPAKVATIWALTHACTNKREACVTCLNVLHKWMGHAARTTHHHGNGTRGRNWSRAKRGPKSDPGGAECGRLQRCEHHCCVG